MSVRVVPHTHWDREWYEPFQTFRMRLVELVDLLLRLFEADPRFVYTLDGQLATVDDYLEVRPEAHERIRGLIEAGRLAVGPWQTLMDEFLVSGETIVRNLETGWRRAEELGGAMPVGYLPDMFGHVAQMPQILRRAGIADAAVWRGVPAAIDRHAFEWQAPDGSAVRTEYLVGGYGNAAYLLTAPGRLATQLELFERAVRPFFGDDPLLAMLGTDHAEPLPELIDTLLAANGAQQRYRLEVETLRDYVGRSRDGRAEALPRWEGELRSAARANLLMGVTSARVGLKAACGRAERLLERYAEPLQALHGADWPESLLELAWKRVIDNSAHDSICGCSVDAVHEQMLVRYAEAEQIASGLAQRAAEAVARRVPAGSMAVLNPSPFARSGLVELDLPVPDDWEQVALSLPGGMLAATQETGRTQTALLAVEMPGAQLPGVFRRLHGRELFGRWLNGYHVDELDGRPRLTFDVGEEPDPPWLDMGRLEREVTVAAQARADERWQLRVLARPRRTLLASVAVPALGATAVRAVEASGAQEGAVCVAGDALDNGLVVVEPAKDGNLSIAGGGVRLEGVGRLVDGGDFGDSYNYAPPAADALVDEPESVVVEVRCAGPLSGRLDIARRYRWPVAVAADGSARSRVTAPVTVTTSVELRAGEPFVRLGISLENACRDHRLRAHVPLGAPARTSFAEGQFAVVERTAHPEGGWGELPLATFPARGFVDAGGVAVLLAHSMEYELVGEGELALTLLRCVGLISRNAHPYREEPAGPEVAVPGAQCQGPIHVEFAVFPHAGRWSDADVLAQMERYQHPLLTAAGTGRHDEAGQPSAGLELTGDGVVLSSLRRRGEWLELRLVCQRPEARDAVVTGGFVDAREVDLLGRPAGRLELRSGTVGLRLGAWEIRTVQLRR